ncbi:MAG: hypothetical protein ACYC2Y_10235 [Armatimonadota bacterium]
MDLFRAVEISDIGRPETVTLELRRYQEEPERLENDLVAKLPGLVLSQYIVPQCSLPCFYDDRLALRFDFVDDWYCIHAYLNGDKRPTGHYRISMQTPLRLDEGVWRGDSLVLGLEVLPGFEYKVTGEERFVRAVDEGWIRISTASHARDALRGLCSVLEDRCLPPEVMDAVGENTG